MTTEAEEFSGATLLEIRVHGLQRSGNHAVVNWIAMQTKGTCAYLNDAVPGTNPFESMQEYLEYHDGRLDALVYTWDTESRTRAVSKASRTRSVLIHSYEDRTLSPRIKLASRTWLGNPKRFYDLLIVRDPLNFFASRLQMWDALTGIQERSELVRLWKDYVSEALGQASKLDPQNRIVVNFTKWNSDVSYRKGIAQALGLKFSDSGVSRMLKVGYGSSFDEFQFETNASMMRVNERWKRFVANPDFRAILADQELQDLSLAFFGEQDGWNAIFATS